MNAKPPMPSKDANRSAVQGAGFKGWTLPRSHRPFACVGDGSQQRKGAEVCGERRGTASGSPSSADTVQIRRTDTDDAVAEFQRRFRIGTECTSQLQSRPELI